MPPRGQGLRPGAALIRSSCATEEDEFFHHDKIDLTRHAHTPSGVAGADLKSQGGEKCNRRS